MLYFSEESETDDECFEMEDGIELENEDVDDVITLDSQASLEHDSCISTSTGTNLPTGLYRTSKCNTTNPITSKQTTMA